ncbi:hypothetical protein EDD22DRAFT_964834 [Suillus occidentalis]|nr:hypothetical protein EDD22DRAFT_964834 [Suillus occidentalis]
MTSYSQHLTLTSNPVCHTLYLTSQNYNPSPTPDPDPAQLEGDYFEMEDNPEWPGFDEQMNTDDCSNPADEKQSDDDQDKDGFNEWEPPLSQQSHSTCPNDGGSDMFIVLLSYGHYFILDPLAWQKYWTLLQELT